jgi:hypothetical protein
MQGEPELTPAQRGALAAAAAEMQAQAAALSGGWPPSEPVAAAAAAAAAPEPPRQSGAVCNCCGKAGCSVTCADGLRFLVAPPHARCVPRGPSYFYGCGLGFTPVRGARGATKADVGSMVRGRRRGQGRARAGGSSAVARRIAFDCHYTARLASPLNLSHPRPQDYWRQLGRMMLWQVGVWLFGLMVVAMILAARSKAPVDGLPGYFQVRAARRAKTPNQTAGHTLGPTGAWSNAGALARAGKLPCATRRRLPNPASSRTRPTPTHSQLIWSMRSALICYSLMVVGYALYLTVGFNFIMGSTVRMKQVRVFFGARGRPLSFRLARRWLGKGPALHHGLGALGWLSSPAALDLITPSSCHPTPPPGRHQHVFLDDHRLRRPRRPRLASPRRGAVHARGRGDARGRRLPGADADAADRQPLGARQKSRGTVGVEPGASGWADGVVATAC